MAAKLAASDFLRSRTPDSERIVIAINKVENLTSDIIPESDQWWMMAHVRDAQGIRTLSEQKNIRVVIPAEILRKAKKSKELPEEAALARSPTHEMSATFRSATRNKRLDRTDAYLCEYRITSIKDGSLEWADSFEFKKVAFGRSYD
jgi:hypothetical protein